MNSENTGIIAAQKEYFATGATLPVEFRKQALRRLYRALEDYEGRLFDALKSDLGKSAFESYMCETGLVKSEISYMLKHVDRLSAEKTRPTPLSQFASRSFVKPSPRGCVLIMSPWNYPVLLSLDPLVDAISAGNTAVLKPSAYAPGTSRVLKELAESIFSPEYVTVVTGGREENSWLLKQDFDYIFFTGSSAVGREVLRNAAERLTPVTLELGGKSPCIVDATANIKLAARRIVFGKLTNCGQTCVAPDYILCSAGIKDKLIDALKSEIRRQYGERPLQNSDYGKIVNKKHFDRLCSLIDKSNGRLVCGGGRDGEALRIEPVILDGMDFDDSSMTEEIFGPVLPVLTYPEQKGGAESIIAMLKGRPSPLALYIFSSDRKFIKTLQSRLQFGGGCVNDCLIHLATPYMGFGGVGESGMGSYHGRDGFRAFSHYKSIVDKKTWLDLPMRYQPFKESMFRLVRMFLR